MIKARKFVAGDATAVAQLVATTLRTTNRKDYSAAYIEHDIQQMMLPFSSKKRSKRIFMFLLMLRELSGLARLARTGVVKRNTACSIFLFIRNIKVTASVAKL